MNFQLTEEQELLRDVARKFAEEHLAPGVIDRDDKAKMPVDQIKQLGELGFMGIMVPEKWKGAGMDTVSYVLAIEEISRIDASAGVILSINNSLVCQIFLDWANEHQLKSYLTKLASGKWLGAFSLS